MSWEDGRPGTVFLLGAGASHRAGCPTVVEMTNGFRDSISSEPELLEAFDWIVAQLESSDGNQRAIDVELILATLQEARARERNLISVFVHQTGWRREMSRLEAEFRTLDARLRDYIRSACAVDRASIDYLRPLLRIATDQDGPLDIFTLNYDCTIETLCQETNTPYTDGFDTYWNPALFEQAVSGIRLHKLHGSLLWYVTQRRPPRLVKIPVTTGNVRFFTDDDVSESLIYPTILKEQSSEPYSSLIGRLRNSLRSADLLVVIGYSFRDAYLKNLILDNLRENRSLRVLIVDPRARDVLDASDALLDEGWSFRDEASRIQLVPLPAEDALEYDFLTRLIRTKVGATQQLISAQREQSSPDRAFRVNQAAIAVRDVVAAGDFGALFAVLDSDSEGNWHEAIQTLMANEATEALAIACCASNPAFRKWAKSELVSKFRARARYTVYRTSPSTLTFVGEDLGRLSFNDDQISKWVSGNLATAQRVAATCKSLATKTQWHNAESSTLLASLAKDYAALAEYWRGFESGWTIAENQAARFSGNLHGSPISFPRPRDENVIVSYTERMLDGLPTTARSIPDPA